MTDGWFESFAQDGRWQRRIANLGSLTVEWSTVGDVTAWFLTNAARTVVVALAGRRYTDPFPAADAVIDVLVAARVAEGRAAYHAAYHELDDPDCGVCRPTRKATV